MKRLIPLLVAMVLLTGCGMLDVPADTSKLPAEEETLLTINGRAIPAWRYFCWLERACSAAEEVSEETEATLKEQALFDTALYAAVEDLAAQYDVTLTEEERSAIDPAPWANLPDQQQSELTNVGGLYAKLCALVQQDTMLVSEETELAAFLEENPCITLDRILIPTGEGASDSMAALYTQLNGGGKEAFDAAKSQSADTAGARTFCVGDGTVSPAIESAVAVLESGQLSGILETEEGYSVLLRLPLDMAAVAVLRLDHRLDAAARSASVETTNGYDQLDVSVFRAERLRKAT